MEVVCMEVEGRSWLEYFRSIPEGEDGEIPVYLFVTEKRDDGTMRSYAQQIDTLHETDDPSALIRVVERIIENKKVLDLNVWAFSNGNLFNLYPESLVTLEGYSKILITMVIKVG